MTTDEMLEKIRHILAGPRDPCTKLVLCTLVLHGAEAGATILLSTDEIAVSTGLPIQAVERALITLQEAGLPMKRINITTSGVPDA
jgi:hypothetical protein